MGGYGGGGSSGSSCGRGCSNSGSNSRTTNRWDDKFRGISSLAPKHNICHGVMLVVAVSFRPGLLWAIMAGVVSCHVLSPCVCCLLVLCAVCHGRDLPRLRRERRQLPTALLHIIFPE